MPAARRLIKFIGGPSDGLECRDDSADRFESSIAIVWSLFRIGCGGPLIPPALLARREEHRRQSPEAAGAPRTLAGDQDGDGETVAHYRVIRRSMQGGVLVSVAWHAEKQSG